MRRAAAETRAKRALLTGRADRYSFEVPNGWKNETVGKVGERATSCLSLQVMTGLTQLTSLQVEKGMQGIDTRVTNPKGKGACALQCRASTGAPVLTLQLCAAAQQAFVVTFGRAGEDNKKFKLGDADLTLQGFAGADYDLQASRL